MVLRKDSRRNRPLWMRGGSTPTPPSPYYSVGTDCVLYYDFGDGLESSVDHSTYSHDGTITGGTFTTVGGKPCLLLDGIDDKLVTPDITETASIAHWSLYYWEYYIANNGSDVVFATGPGGGRTGMWHWGIDYFYLGEGSTLFNAAPIIMPTGEWILVQIVYDGTLAQANRFKVYWNGEERGMKDSTVPTTLSSTTTPWYFGCYLDGASYRSNIGLGQVLMFTSTRTDMVDYFNFTKARYVL